MNMDKAVYVGVVRSTIKMMFLLAVEHGDFNLNENLADYYNKALKKEGVISKNEYINLCNSVINK